MMLQDQLTKQERLRLECFSQAVASSFTILIDSDMQNRPSIEDLFEQAKKIEAFLKSANPN